LCSQRERERERERERTLKEFQAAEGAKRAEKDDSDTLRRVSSGAEAEIIQCRKEERLSEQMLLYLRSEVAGARDELGHSQALGRRVEEGVRAELGARVAVEVRLAEERQAQHQEHRDALQQQKQRSEVELAARNKKVRALEVEVEEKSWRTIWHSAGARN
jgi:hypothetical protein